MLINISECFEELDAGEGELAVDSYYYDSNENRCLFFWYAGSGGNGNRYVLIYRTRAIIRKLVFPLN